MLGPETDDPGSDTDAALAHTLALALVVLLRTDSAILIREQKPSAGYATRSR